MRLQKKAVNAAARSVQDKVFFTEADIRTIIREVIQEALAELITDDEPETETDNGHSSELTKERLALTVQEAADLLGISKPKMLELLHNGEISHRRVGKKILISHQTLVSWLNQ